MKVDVVINFYRKFHEWPFVVWGLQRNRDAINRVLLVNDEPWCIPTRDAITIVAGDLPITLMDHEHDGFGGHKCINQGMRAVETEYWCAIDADVILMPDALSRLLDDAAPRSILYPEVHDIALDSTVTELESPRIMREGGYGRVYKSVQPWVVYRDLFTLEHTATSLELGGRAEYPGYGFIDYDYGCRWAMRYGLDNVVLLHPHAYTFASTSQAKPTLDNRRLFSKTLRIYANKYLGGHALFTFAD